MKVPSAPKASRDRELVNAKLSRPIRQYFSLAVKFVQVCVTPITRLVMSSGPTTIARFIIPVWVNTVNRQFRRLVPHISKKILEPEPGLTHSYSPFSVVSINGAFRVCTPLNNAFPYPISWSSVHSMFSEHFVGYFSLDTTTRLCSTDTKTV